MIGYFNFTRPEQDAGVPPTRPASWVSRYFRSILPECVDVWFTSILPYGLNIPSQTVFGAQCKLIRQYNFERAVLVLVTQCELTKYGTAFRFQAAAEMCFSSSKRPYLFCGSHFCSRRLHGRGFKLPIRLHLMTSLKMRGASIHSPIRLHGEQRDIFYLYLFSVRFFSFISSSASNS